MALTRLNNRSVSAVTALPSGLITRSDLPLGTTLQAVSTSKTDSFTTTSQSYVDLMTLNITPLRSSSRILLIYHINGSTAGDIMHGYLSLIRNSTEIFKGDSASNRRGGTSVINIATQQQMTFSIAYIDSPSTTSTITYKVQALSSNGNTLFINRSARDTDLLAYDGRTVSSFTALEIAN
jgi:hypothetical protein